MIRVILQLKFKSVIHISGCLKFTTRDNSNYLNNIYAKLLSYLFVPTGFLQGLQTLFNLLHKQILFPTAFLWNVVIKHGWKKNTYWEYWVKSEFLKSLRFFTWYWTTSVAWMKCVSHLYNFESWLSDEGGERNFLHPMRLPVTQTTIQLQESPGIW